MGDSRKIEHMADLELTIRYEDIEDGWVDGFRARTSRRDSRKARHEGMRMKLVH